MTRAVFLDKDGTLIPDVPYNVDPERMTLLPGAREALRELHAAGYLLIVITNQAGVARGLFEETALAGVEARLRDLLGPEIPLAGFYHCPHHPEGTVAALSIQCECRKPAPGMLLRAAAEHGIDVGESWFVGDILNDIEAGRRAGCRTILVGSANETRWELTCARTPHAVARDLPHVTAIILGSTAQSGRTLTHAGARP